MYKYICRGYVCIYIYVEDMYIYIYVENICIFIGYVYLHNYIYIYTHIHGDGTYSRIHMVHNGGLQVNRYHLERLMPQKATTLAPIPGARERDHRRFLWKVAQNILHDGGTATWNVDDKHCKCVCTCVRVYMCTCVRVCLFLVS